jgi:hypothetical protein
MESTEELESECRVSMRKSLGMRPLTEALNVKEMLKWTLGTWDQTQEGFNCRVILP